MLRPTSMMSLAIQVNRFVLSRTHPPLAYYSTLMQSPIDRQRKTEAVELPYVRINSNAHSHFPTKDSETLQKLQIGENVPRKDKIQFLVSTLVDLPDSKETVYRTLDAWVAWERNFPIAFLKNVLLALEKQQQWHRMIQVIKWMLSKGQGTTRGTYGQLIQALDMDHRVEEAHEIWKKKLGYDLHSVPWKLCKLMTLVYYRNNMHEELVKLFKGLKAFDRKPPEKSIVQKVADAYELLGLHEEKEQVMEKYKHLFLDTKDVKPKKLIGSGSMKKR